MNPFFEQTLTTTFALAFLIVPGIQAANAEVVYIPLGSANEVVIVDTVKETVVGKISGLPAIHGLAGTPDGQYLIAGSYSERDAGTDMPLKPTAVSDDDHAAHHGPAPEGAEEDNTAISTVSVVRTSDKTVVRRIDVPGAVHHVAVSPDSRYAVVTHPDVGRISTIDLSTFTVVFSGETGSLPNYAAFSPDGRELYVSNSGDSTVSAFDTKSWQVTWTVSTGVSPEHVVLSPDGGRLYVNDVDDGSVSIIDVKQRAVVGTVEIEGTLHGIDLSDDGQMLFVAALGEDKLIRVDLLTGQQESISLSPSPYHLAVIRGTGKLYLSSSDQPMLWVIDQKTLKVLGEIQIGGKGHQMVMGTRT